MLLDVVRHAPKLDDPQPGVNLIEVQAERIYSARDMPSVLATNASRPRTIRPDAVVVKLTNGLVAMVGVAGTTIRRDGSDGARWAMWFSSWNFAELPDWVAEVIERDGLKWQPSHHRP